jgi:hypothetical protein
MGMTNPPVNLPTWRILGSHCEGRPFEIAEDAFRKLCGDYERDSPQGDKVRVRLNEMWRGGRFRTAGHEYWIEKQGA